MIQAKKVIRRESTNHTKKHNILTYDDIEYDNGWVKASEYVPIEFDLMALKIEGREKVYFGWWTGGSWEGTSISKKYIITNWKCFFKYIKGKK